MTLTQLQYRAACYPTEANLHAVRVKRLALQTKKAR